MDLRQQTTLYGEVGIASNADIDQRDPNLINAEYANPSWDRFNMAGFTAPKLDTVRVGIIGLGNLSLIHL